MIMREVNEQQEIKLLWHILISTSQAFGTLSQYSSILMSPRSVCKVTAFECGQKTPLHMFETIQTQRSLPTIDFSGAGP